MSYKITHSLSRRAEKINPDPDKIYDITIILKETSKPAKGKWAKVAERFEQESFLQGRSEEVIKHGREFRDNFALRSLTDK